MVYLVRGFFALWSLIKCYFKPVEGRKSYIPILKVLNTGYWNSNSSSSWQQTWGQEYPLENALLLNIYVVGTMSVVKVSFDIDKCVNNFEGNIWI